MADITEDLLQTLAAGDPIAMLLVATAGKPAGRELRAIAAELLAARAEMAAVDAAISDRGVAERDCRLPVAERIDNILVELKECSFQFGTAAMENERLCAEVERLRGQLQADDQRAWEALGKPEGTHDTTNVQRLCAEVERLRAELRAVATIAHEGGLAELGEGPPLTAIRRRTLCWWDRTGSRADAYARVRAAMKHKETP